MTNYREPIRPINIVYAFETMDERLTRRQIAERLDRKPAPHLNNMIDSLVTEGYLNREVVTLPNGVDMFVYSRIVPLE